MELYDDYEKNNIESLNRWQCGKCGYVHNEAKAPKKCPVCEHYRVGGIN